MVIVHITLNVFTGNDHTSGAEQSDNFQPRGRKSFEKGGTFNDAIKHDSLKSTETQMM